MTFDLYANVSTLAVISVQFLIGTLKHVLLQRFFLYFLNVVFVCNTCCLISQMTLMKKNLKNLGLSLGHLVRMNPDWVNYCVAYYLL